MAQRITVVVLDDTGKEIDTVFVQTDDQGTARRAAIQHVARTRGLDEGTLRARIDAYVDDETL
jgi:hypothetical protein